MLDYCLIVTGSSEANPLFKPKASNSIRFETPKTSNEIEHSKKLWFGKVFSTRNFGGNPVSEEPPAPPSFCLPSDTLPRDP